MSRRVWLLTLALALGGPAGALVDPPCASAQSMADVERARKLVDEAQAPFKRAADTSLDSEERKSARRDAHKLLKEARDLYIRYLDAHPGEEESFDGEFSKMAMMLHFIKKHAGIWEFEPRRTPEPEPTAPKGGDEGTTPPDKPTPPKTDDPPPKTEDPAPVAPEPAPEPTPAEQAAAAYERILAFRTAHPGDITGLQDLCLRFLADFDDPDLPSYEDVMLLSGRLTERLNAFYKEQTNEDPDAMEGESKDLLNVIARLSNRVRKGEDAARIKAARLLGETRSGAASFPLVKLLREDEPELRKAAHDGLVLIGGARAAENLVSTFRNSTSDEDQLAALEVLVAIANKGSVDAKSASRPIGRFVLSNKEEVAGKALDVLASLGKAGGPGLEEALETRLTQKKVEVIQKIGDSGYYPAASRLCNYLIKTDKPGPVEFKAAAIAALKKMGVCAVPHMLNALSSSRTRLWTAQVLREMTGQRISSKPKPWRDWYEANRPASGCE